MTRIVPMNPNYGISNGKRDYMEPKSQLDGTLENRQMLGMHSIVSEGCYIAR